ncbi:MAG: hypothetical protein U0U69_05000 [Acidimicrobiia bacterium]
MTAVTVTPIGWAVLPFVIVFVAAIVTLVVVLRRRRRQEIVGFDRDEAISYVWGNLPRLVKRRVALVDVVSVVDAQLAMPAADAPDDDAALVAALCLMVAERDGVELDPDDVARMVVLQYRYAEAKGLM